MNASADAGVNGVLPVNLEGDCNLSVSSSASSSPHIQHPESRNHHFFSGRTGNKRNTGFPAKLHRTYNRFYELSDFSQE